MEAYTGFAQVYDELMDNVPYEAWGRRLLALLRQQGIHTGLLAELGCGTGKLTRQMAADYELIAVDNSPEMLELAAFGGTEHILYIMQDMRELSLGGGVSAVYSACDSMNYLVENGDFARTLAGVKQALSPGGLLIFDLNTPYKYRTLLEEHTFAENREAVSFIWENYYDEESRINEYDLTLFVREEPGLFRRFEEIHYQRCYEIGEVRELLAEAGFELLGVYDDYSERPLHDESERALFVARKPNTF